MQEERFLETIKKIESNKKNLKLVESTQSEIDNLWDQFFEMEYFEGKNRSSFQRFVSRLPSLYILSKVNRTGLKNLLVNIRGYRAIKKNNLLDLGYYLKNNSDVRLLGMDPILHYMYYGFIEGRKPNSTFNGNNYLKTHKDVKTSKINPLVHYSLFGVKEGRKSEKYPKKNKKRILYVVHHGEGGTQHTNEDLMIHIQKDFDCYLLSSTSKRLKLWKYEDSHFEEIKTWLIKSKWSAKDFHNQEFKNIYWEVLNKLKIDIVHIRHLILHTFDLTDLTESLGIPVVLSFHDFYFICPSFTLLDNNNIYCAGKCTKGNGQCNVLMNILKDLPQLRTFVDMWRTEVSKVFSSTSAFVTTSEVVKQIFISIYPQLSQKEFRIIEHGRDFKTINGSSELYEIPSKDKPIKILVPGDIKTHKGADLIKEIKNQDTDSNIEFNFIGVLPEDLSKYGIYHGPYDRDNFCEEVKKIKPSFIGIFSIWPETYCHTLSEAWSCGVPVLTSKIGVLEERVNNDGGGWLLDYKNPIKAYNEIIRIVNSREEYIKVAEQVKKINFKSTKNMAQEYLDLYFHVLEKQKTDIISDKTILHVKLDEKETLLEKKNIEIIELKEKLKVTENKVKTLEEEKVDLCSIPNFESFKRSLKAKEGFEDFLFLVNDSNFEMRQHFDQSYINHFNSTLFIENFKCKEEFCRNRNIKYYFFLVPDKSYVCRNLLPFDIKIIKRNYDLIKHLAPDFADNLDHTCYWNTDTHVNFEGGKELSYNILNHINNKFKREEFNKLIDEQMIITYDYQKFPSCDLVSEDNWSYSDNERLKYCEEETIFYTNKYIKDIKDTLPEKFKFFSERESDYYLNENSFTNLRVLILRDSSANYLKIVLSTYFKEVLTYWDHWIFNKELIEWYKPDIVLEIRTERLLENMESEIIKKKNEKQNLK